MTHTFHASAQCIKHESALQILIPRRNARAFETRAATRFAILRTIGALRILRGMGGAL